MDIWLLDRDRKSIGIVDDYISLIWTERYNEAGDFELLLPINARFAKWFIADNYLWNKESNAVMMIEYIEIKTDYENGNRIVLKGHSVEYTLNRRIMQDVTFDEASMTDVMKAIFELHFVDPEDIERKIDFIRYTLPSSDISELAYSGNVIAASCYEVMVDACKQTQLGFRALMSHDGIFTFSLYDGVDRSWSQTKNPWRVYSPKYNNLLSTDFYENTEEFHNAAIICGEEASTTTNPSTGDTYYWPQVWTSISKGETGMARKEAFIDLSDLERWSGVWRMGGELEFQKKPEADQTRGWKKLPELLYKRMLEKKAMEELNEEAIDTKFEAEMDYETQWVLNRDIFLGDIVQVENEYGMTMRCRLSEVTLSHDINGKKAYPTFEDADLLYEPTFVERS